MADNAGEIKYPDTRTGEVNIRDPITNGPIADSIKYQASNTRQEFRDLKSAKVVPSTTTATGQPLTYYHSLLYSLLSWEQPRATAASYASVVVFIFAARYLPLLRWFFKFLYVVLFFTGVAEIGGRLLLSQGVTTSFRPRKYYTLPKETIEAVVEDFEQLVDFVLIEFQRILFAENIIHTIAGFSAAFSAYWLIKVLPFWGLSLLAVTIAYMGPLVYINNRELIDSQIAHAQQIVNSQALQLRDLAEERTYHATGVVKQYVGDYSNKAQEYIGNRRSASPEVAKTGPVVKREPEPEAIVKTSDFPEAPKDEPVAQSVETQPAAMKPEQEPLLAV